MADEKVIDLDRLSRHDKNLTLYITPQGTVRHEFTNHMLYIIEYTKN